MRQLLDLLHDEWQSLAHSDRAARRLADWAAIEPALAGYSDLSAVVSQSQRRGRPAESDRILLALLRQAPADDLAARVVLQAVMPGLKSLMSAYQLTGGPEEVATAVVEAAFERIRRYPCDRRPARVAANLLHDTRQVLWRDGCRERRLRLATEPLTERIHDCATEWPPNRSATDELVELVADGVRLGHISRSGARLILLTRVLDVPIDELARDGEMKAPTVRKRRLRAEAALARAAVA